MLSGSIACFVFLVADASSNMRFHSAVSCDKTTKVSNVESTATPWSLTNLFLHSIEGSFIHSFIHAYELMLGLHVFRQTGPPRRVDCLAPPSVCHTKTEASR